MHINRAGLVVSTFLARNVTIMESGYDRNRGWPNKVTIIVRLTLLAGHRLLKNQETFFRCLLGGAWNL